MGKTLADLKAEWMRDPEVRAEYDALAEEFSHASAKVAGQRSAKIRRGNTKDTKDTK
ncbi:MAG: hypothetical protein HQL39_09910 [Alphaproteobacteria bacterium]|nr:hypothetical protein [Alphaproteobacteria bacterium]